MSAQPAERSLAALERALGASAYAGWRRFDPGASVSVDARYAALPALTKVQLRRDFPSGFVPRGFDFEGALARGEVEVVETAGTTGDAVRLLWHQGWWDASERASWQLNADARRCATGGHREAVLASARCVGPPYRAEPRTMEERTLGRLLFLNGSTDVARWTDGDVARIADELARFRPVVLEADPHYLAAFARRARARGLVPYQPELIVYTYAWCSQAHRRQIRAAFGAPMISSHGSTECGYVFMECERGRHHQNTETCRVDAVPLTSAQGGPRLAQLLVTPFGHPCFSILRFDIGDLAMLSESACPCGRTEGLTLDALAGRGRDVTFTPGGRLVTVLELDESLREVSGLLDYRLEQTAAASYRFRFISDAPRADGETARQALWRLYGSGAEVTVEAVAALTPEPSGKYRLASRAGEVDLAPYSATPPPRAP